MARFQTLSRRAYCPCGLIALFVFASGTTCGGNNNASESCDQRLAGSFKVTGIIDDVINTSENYDDPNYFLVQTNKDVRFHIVLDLKTEQITLPPNGKAELKGTATITWSSHANNVNRTECSPGNPVIQYRDYDDRTWVGAVTATITCNFNKEMFISGISTPDGSQLEQFYHITENCTSFTRDAEDDARATWNGFGPFKIDLNEMTDPLTYGEVNVRNDVVLPDGIYGEKYLEAHLTVTRM